MLLRSRRLRLPARGQRKMGGKSRTPLCAARVAPSFSSDVDGQIVVRGKESRWQRRLELRVEVVVRQMREIRTLRAHQRRRLDGLRYAHVRWMLLPEQRVEHQHLHPAQ